MIPSSSFNTNYILSDSINNNSSKTLDATILKTSSVVNNPHVNQIGNNTTTFSSSSPLFGNNYSYHSGISHPSNSIKVNTSIFEPSTKKNNNNTQQQEQQQQHVVSPLPLSMTMNHGNNSLPTRATSGSTGGAIFKGFGPTNTDNNQQQQHHNTNINNTKILTSSDESVKYSNNTSTNSPHVQRDLSLRNLSESSNQLLLKTSEEIDKKVQDVENWVNKKTFIYVRKALMIGLILFVLLFIIMSTLVGIVIYGLESVRINSIREGTKYNCLMAESAIKREIEVAITALDNIRETIISWDYNVNSNKFDDFASTTSQYEFYNVINTFGFTKNYTLTEVYPTNVLKSLVGQEIGADQNHLKQLIKAIETNGTTIFGPFLTVGNGYSLMAQQPILDLNMNFWGFTIVVLEFQDIFNQVNLTMLLENYSVRFYDVQQNTVFYQRLLNEHRGYDLDNLDGKFIFEAINITIIDSTWELLLIPKDSHDGYVLALEILVPILLVGFGLAAILLSLIVFAYHTVQVRGDKEKQKIFTQTYETMENERVEFATKVDKFIENFKEEEKKWKNIINSFKEALVIVEFTDCSNYTVYNANDSFRSLFEYNENEEIDLKSILPKFNLYEKWLSYKERAQDREIYFPLVFGHKKYGETCKLSLNVTFYQSKESETLVMSIISLKKKTSVNPERIASLEENQEQFLKMLRSEKTQFLEFLKKNSIDTVNLNFISDVEQYKKMPNLKERLGLMNKIINTFIKSGPKERLCGVHPDAITTLLMNAKDSKDAKLDMFDTLVSIVIQDFFFEDVFDKWIKSRP